MNTVSAERGGSTIRRVFRQLMADKMMVVACAILLLLWLLFLYFAITFKYFD